MKATWWQALATPVMWLGVAVLLWALGAWLVLVLMSEAIDELLFDVVVRVALVIALAAGIALSRRTPTGYLVIALAAGACVVLFAGAFVSGSTMATVALPFAVLTASAACVRWFAGRSTESVQAVEAGGGTGKAPHSPVEAAATSAFAIAGLLVLARVLLTLVRMLAELPGASDHQAGDVVMALVLYLPIPTLAGVVLLATARWLWGHRIGARRAAVAWIALVGACSVWILAVVGFLAGQGNYIYPLDDPLLWAPIAGLAGSVAGVALLVAIEVQRRLARPAHPSHG